MIDARGRSCPEPVIMIKKAMASGATSYEMTVDNQVAVENITRFVQHNGYTASVTESGDDFVLQITKK